MVRLEPALLNSIFVLVDDDAIFQKRTMALSIAHRTRFWQVAHCKMQTTAFFARDSVSIRGVTCHKFDWPIKVKMAITSIFVLTLHNILLLFFRVIATHKEVKELAYTTLSIVYLFFTSVNSCDNIKLLLN